MPQKTSISATRNQKKYILALAIGILLLIYILNILYPLYSDDWLYRFVYNSEPLKRTEAITDILTSQYAHYHNWGGRIVAHTIAQLLLLSGEDWADFFNAVIFILFIFLIYRICLKKSNDSIIIFAGIFALFWFLLPDFTGNVLWITGSANYLWVMVIAVWFLSFYYSFYFSGRNISGIWSVPVFFIFGTIAGGTNENIFVAQLFFTFIICIYAKKEKKEIPLWMIAGIGGLLAGGIIMLAAPGNFIRAGIISDGLGLTDKSIWENSIYRLVKISHRYIIYILPLTAIYTLSFIIFKKTGNSNPKKLKGSVLFLLTAHVAWLAMAASPIFPPRATFGIITFMILSIGILWSGITINKKKYVILKYISISILLVIFTIDYTKDCLYFGYIKKEFKNREEIIAYKKQQGETDIVFENRIKSDSKHSFEDLSDNPVSAMNKEYSTYYGINSVLVLQKTDE